MHLGDVLFRISTLTLFLACLNTLRGDPVTVRYIEGSEHGFLSLRSADGKVLAAGDLTQVVHGDRVTSRLVFHFRDGSVDDETATFTQRDTFKLISDHHIQKGPIFPINSDTLIDVGSGNVTVHYREKDKEQVEKAHFDFPPDLANGDIINVVKNLSPDGSERTLSYLATTPKPRMVKLHVKAAGEEKFKVEGYPYEATKFQIKIELGGVAGLVAPLVGKQPPDMYIWVSEKDTPAFVKSMAEQFMGGPIWSIQLSSPVWPH